MLLGSCVKIEQVMEDSQLIMFVNPVQINFPITRLKSLRVVYKLVEGLLSNFLLKFRRKESHMSPKKHSEKLKTWFHAQNNKFYTIIGTSNKSEDVIAHPSVKSGVALVQWLLVVRWRSFGAPLMVTHSHRCPWLNSQPREIWLDGS
jgi:hypothetical protein